MGMMRLILAIAVVLSHGVNLFNIHVVSSVIAVQAFYVISGFYMSLILDGKYKTKSYSLFISNRMLRLLPIYWIVAACMIIVSVAWHFISDQGGDLFLNGFVKNSSVPSPVGWILIFFSNVFLIFQDAFLFLSFSKEGYLQFASNFRNEAYSLADFLLVPQAWTIGLEILFYLIVPFIINLRNNYLVLIAAGSLTLRFIFYKIGYDFDPWTFRFFPFEILFFILGMLAFRGYKYISKERMAPYVGTILFFLLLVYTIFYYAVPLSDYTNKALYFGLLTVALPFIFHKFKLNKYDRFIGEFSYPVYLSHVFVILLCGVINSKYLHFQKQLLDIIIIVSTLLFSLILIKFVSEPLENFRQRR